MLLFTDTSRAFLAPPHWKDSDGDLLFWDDKAGSEVAKSAKMKLFEHMVRFGRRRAAKNVPHVPRPALDVEMSKFQRTTIFNPTFEDYTTGAIIRDMCGEGAKQKLAKRKLDEVGEVHSGCGVANTPDRIRRLQVRSPKPNKVTPALTLLSRFHAFPIYKEQVEARRVHRRDRGPK